MARLARIAVVNVAHHVTQRGIARQFILTNDDVGGWRGLRVEFSTGGPGFDFVDYFELRGGPGRVASL